MNPKKIEAGELFGRFDWFNICTGARYIGGYIRYKKYKVD